MKKITKKKIDWKKVWRNFDSWWYRASPEDAQWEAQQRKIEKLVEKQLS